MKKVAFHTLGCKVNHYESEAMMDLFKRKNYQIVDFEQPADIYIINSCAVTNEAARKSRQLARKARRNNPEATIAMLGCYPQVSPDEVKKMEELDLIIGSSCRDQIVDLIEDLRQGKEVAPRILSYKELREYEDLELESLQETTRAYVKIQEGCNQFCTYCIIPYARGPIRSRKVDAILQEVEKLARKGVKEIVLTGTHLGAYGYDWRDREALLNLLKELIPLEGIKQIRLSSIEVTEVSEDLIQLIAQEEKLCPHFHLPLQSGSDYILKRMHRPYTTEEFREKVARIRSVLGDPAITTDLIVGFPGETEEYFQESKEFVQEIGFSRLHVFPFSPRQGTQAARMKEQISGNIKKRYSQEMRKINAELMLAYQKRHLGEIRGLVVEEKRDQATGLLVGMTDNYIRVLLEEADAYQGSFVPVKLLATYDYEHALGKIALGKRD